MEWMGVTDWLSLTVAAKVASTRDNIVMLAREIQSREDEDPSLVCSDCGRRCLSRIGLVSHWRVHQPGSERGRHVINGNVGQP